MSIQNQVLRLFSSAANTATTAETQPHQHQGLRGISSYSLAATSLTPLLAGCCDEKTAGAAIGGTVLLAGGAAAWAVLRRQTITPRIREAFSSLPVPRLMPRTQKKPDNIITALERATQGKTLSPKKAGQLVNDALVKASQSSEGNMKLIEALLLAEKATKGYVSSNMTTLYYQGNCLDLATATAEVIDAILRLAFVLTGSLDKRTTLSDEDTFYLFNELTKSTTNQEGAQIGKQLEEKIFDSAAGHELANKPLVKHWLSIMTDNSQPREEAFRAFRLMCRIFDPCWFHHLGDFGLSKLDLRPDIDGVVSSISHGSHF